MQLHGQPLSQLLPVSSSVTLGGLVIVSSILACFLIVSDHGIQFPERIHLRPHVQSHLLLPAPTFPWRAPVLTHKLPPTASRGKLPSDVMPCESVALARHSPFHTLPPPSLARTATAPLLCHRLGSIHVSLVWRFEQEQRQFQRGVQTRPGTWESHPKAEMVAKLKEFSVGGRLSKLQNYNTWKLWLITFRLGLKSPSSVQQSLHKAGFNLRPPSPRCYIMSD